MTAEAAPFDVSYHPGRTRLYSPPLQRQRWGETQVIPRVNWGDIFFDLFYVAATYNISNIVVTSPTWEGLLYAAGTFLPTMMFWTEKVFYDARFTMEDDLFHRLYEVFMVVIVAMAVLHIRPVDAMSNAAENHDMFIFCVVITIERILAAGLYVDLLYFGVGQNALRTQAQKQVVRLLAAATGYTVAAGLSGSELYGNGIGGRRVLLSGEETSASYQTNETNAPILVILATSVAISMWYIVDVVFLFPSDGRHKEM